MIAIIVRQVKYSIARLITLRQIVCCFIVISFVYVASACADSPQADTVLKQNDSSNADISGQSRQINEFNVLFDFRPIVRATGFLLAREEGYYRDEGLPPVHFSWNGNDWNWSDLSSGKVQFVVSVFPRACEGLARDNRPIILSQFVQATTFGLLFRTDYQSKVNKIGDFNKKRIGVHRGEVSLAKSLLHAHGIDLESISLAGSGRELLVPGGLDALCLHSYELPGMIIYSRYRKIYSYIPIAQSQNVLPEDCLFCDRDFLASRRAQCSRFVNASWRGWRLAADKPEKAISILRTYCQKNQIPFDELVAKAELKNYISCLRFGSPLETSGVLSPEVYVQAIDLLINAGVLPREKAPKYEEFFESVMLARGELIGETGSISGEREGERVP